MTGSRRVRGYVLVCVGEYHECDWPKEVPVEDPETLEPLDSITSIGLVVE